MKRLYIIVAAIFYSSIPVALNNDKVALIAHGYGVELAFMRRDVAHDNEMIGKYYFAYKESADSMVFIVRSAIAIWVITLMFSLYVVARKKFSLPYKLHLVTLVSSALAIAVFVLLPFILFGFGPPPSPL